MGLEPHLLMNLSEKGLYEKAARDRYRNLYRMRLLQLCLPVQTGPSWTIYGLENQFTRQLESNKGQAMSEQPIIVSASPHVHSERNLQKT